MRLFFSSFRQPPLHLPALRHCRVFLLPYGLQPFGPSESSVFSTFSAEMPSVFSVFFTGSCLTTLPSWPSPFPILPVPTHLSSASQTALQNTALHPVTLPWSPPRAPPAVRLLPGCPCPSFPLALRPSLTQHLHSTLLLSVCTCSSKYLVSFFY